MTSRLTSKTKNKNSQYYHVKVYKSSKFFHQIVKFSFFLDWQFHFCLPVSFCSRSFNQKLKQKIISYILQRECAVSKFLTQFQVQVPLQQVLLRHLQSQQGATKRCKCLTDEFSGLNNRQ